VKRILHKICIVLLSAFLAAGLAACNMRPGTTDERLGENTASSGASATDISQTTESSSHEAYHEWPIEELGEIIVAAGTFWEDWWRLIGPFDWKHFDQFDWDYNPLPEYVVTSSPEHAAWLARQDEMWEAYMARFPEHLREGRALGILLPSSGFASIADIRNYLSQYYSEEWLDYWMYNGIPHVGAPFYEYDGMLFVDVTRAGFSRPNWNTAAHTIIEQEGNRVVVETRVLWSSWHRALYHQIEGWEVLYYFTLIDGRIDKVEMPYEVNSVQERTLPLSVEELGSTIVSAGWFWQLLWQWGHESQGNLPVTHAWWQQNMVRGVTVEIYDIGDSWVLPESGIKSLDDVRYRLSNYFTESWIEQLMSTEPLIFIDYDTLLHIYFPQLGAHDTSRPSWGAATHVMVEQEGSHAIIETTVLMAVLEEEVGEARFRFTFVDGRIDSVDECPWFAE